MKRSMIAEMQMLMDWCNTFIPVFVLCSSYKDVIKFRRTFMKSADGLYCRAQINPDNCECAHYVVPAPNSMTSRGWGCRYTGGHCLPSEKCDNMERVYIAESRQSVELLGSKNLIATDFNL